MFDKLPKPISDCTMSEVRRALEILLRPAGAPQCYTESLPAYFNEHGARLEGFDLVIQLPDRPEPKGVGGRRIRVFAPYAMEDGVDVVAQSGNGVIFGEIHFSGGTPPSTVAAAVADYAAAIYAAETLR